MSGMEWYFPHGSSFRHACVCNHRGLEGIPRDSAWRPTTTFHLHGRSSAACTTQRCLKTFRPACAGRRAQCRLTVDVCLLQGLAAGRARGGGAAALHVANGTELSTIDMHMTVLYIHLNTGAGGAWAHPLRRCSCASLCRRGRTSAGGPLDRMSTPASLGSAW